MFEIQETTKIDGAVLIVCAPNGQDFVDAEIIKIFDGDDNCFSTKHFTLNRTRQCFNNQPAAPLLGIREAVPANFLKRGNRVALVSVADNTTKRPSVNRMPARELAYA